MENVEKTLKFEQSEDGFSGGRTEAFIREGFNLTGYDINSSYPFSMLEFDMPAGEGFRYQGEPSDAVKERK